jgi:hypothetical protein
MKAKDTSECMHFIRNVSLFDGGFVWDRSLNSLYDQICSLSSQEKTINSSRRFFLDFEKHVKQKISFATENDFLNSHPLVLASFFLNIIGSSGDFLVILVIAMNKCLRKPFYTSILSLCLSDLFYFVHQLVNSCLPDKDICEIIQQQIILEVSTYFVTMFSNLSVVLLASVRYVMFVYPLKSRVYLTNRLIVNYSFTAFGFSIIYGTIVRYIIWSIPFSRIRVLFIADSAILLLTLVVVNVIFLVHRLRVAETSPAAHHLKLRMILVVVVIMILHIIKSLLTIMHNFLQYDVSNTENLRMKFNNLTIFNLNGFSKLIHFIPIVFFLSTPVVIKRIVSFIHKCSLTK